MLSYIVRHRTETPRRSILSKCCQVLRYQISPCYGREFSFYLDIYNILRYTIYMKQVVIRKCEECNKEGTFYLNRGKCPTCYARLYRSQIISDDSLKKAYAYRLKYRELNKDKILASRKKKRQEARAYAREHARKFGRKKYARSPEYIAQVKAQRAEVNAYKVQQGCVDCGYNKHPYALDFDHLRDKKYNIGSLARSRVPRETLWGEIAKCEVRCANCHRIMTYNRRVGLKNGKMLQ